MKIFDFLFKKKKEPEIDFDGIENKSKDVFKLGFSNENDQIRRISEEAIWHLSSPVGKRFLASGINEPNIDNRLFVLKKIYLRGGWRLAEFIIEEAFNYENELTISERANLIYFIGENRDTDTYQYLEKGISDNNIEIRVATISALVGISNKDSIELIKTQLDKCKSDLEKYCCYLALREFNNSEAKEKINEYINDLISTPKLEYIEKLKFLDIKKALPYLLKLSELDDPKINLTLLEMVKDGRASDLLKKLLSTSNKDFLGKVLEKVIKLESHSTLSTLNNLKEEAEISTRLKIAKTILSSNKETHAELVNFFTSIDDLSVLEYYLSFLDGHYFEDIIVKKLFDKINSVDDLNSLSDDDISELIIAIKLSIKLGKMNFLLVIEKFIDNSSIENNNLLRWNLSCYSAVAILCIIERNIVYV